METKNMQLIERAKNGDVDAFAEAFEGLRPVVFSVACRLVGPVDADDVVMETYLKAWQAIPNFSGRSSLKTWLYRITSNCALDFIRSRKRRKEISPTGPEGQDSVSEIPDPGRTPNEEIAAAESAEEVREALSKLPAEHRQTLELRYSDGLSYGEIAAATNVSIGTVMSRIFNGKRKLRKAMREQG